LAQKSEAMRPLKNTAAAALMHTSVAIAQGNGAPLEIPAARA
jgi:hypothetical protein